MYLNNVSIHTYIILDHLESHCGLVNVLLKEKGKEKRQRKRQENYKKYKKYPTYLTSLNCVESGKHLGRRIVP